MKSRIKLSIALAVVLFGAAVAIAGEPTQPVYEVTLRVIEADSPIDPRYLELPRTEAATTEEDFLTALSDLNPGPTFRLLYRLSATTVAGYPASFEGHHERTTTTAMVTPVPKEDGRIQLSLECIARRGSVTFKCEGTTLKSEGQGYLADTLNVGGASSIISFYVLPAPEEPPDTDEQDSSLPVQDEP